MDIVEYLAIRSARSSGATSRYCELIDTKNFDLLTEVFTSDVVWDFTQTEGPDAILRDLGSLIDRIWRHLGPVEQLRSGRIHNIMNSTG